MQQSSMRWVAQDTEMWRTELDRVTGEPTVWSYQIQSQKKADGCDRLP